MQNYIERVVDLLDPGANQLYDVTVEAAQELLQSATGGGRADLQGSFALIARQGQTVTMVRSLDRPMRYFLAKQQSGPILIVADRIDTIYRQL